MGLVTRENDKFEVVLANFYDFFCSTELFRSLVASDCLLVLTDINHSVEVFDLHCYECSLSFRISQPNTVNSIIAILKRSVVEKIGKLMKTVTLLFAMMANVIAFETMYAFNAGGVAHIDSDGIAYREDRVKASMIQPFEIGTVPEADRHIYQSYNTFSTSRFAVKVLKHGIKVTGDGLYALVVKFSSFGGDEDKLSMKLNKDIDLLSKVKQICGGFMKSCDEYFYLCVVDNMVYYNNQSSAIPNGILSIEFSAPLGNSTYAGLVLLKGDLGERRKLVSSNTNDALDFETSKFNDICLKRLPKNPDNEQKTAKDDINVPNLHQEIKVALEGSCLAHQSITLEGILREYKSIQTEQNSNALRLQSIEQNTNKCVNINNQLEQCTTQMDAKFETLETKLASQTIKIDQQQAAIISGIKDLTVEVKADQTRMQEQINKINRQLKEIHNLLRKAIGKGDSTVSSMERRSDFGP